VLLVDNSLIGQLPIFIGSKTDETTGPLCWGFDPDSGSNIGVECTEHVKTGGRGMNLNRTCITKVLPNPAVGRQPKQLPIVDISKKKSKRISFDEFHHDDDNIVDSNKEYSTTWAGHRRACFTGQRKVSPWPVYSALSLSIKRTISYKKFSFNVIGILLGKLDSVPVAVQDCCHRRWH
jgi:hypothetical protein